MINFFLFNKILIILVSTLGIWLGFWVYLSNRKIRANRLFVLMIILALLWIILCYFSGILTDNLRLSLFLGRLAYGVAILFFIPFYFFSRDFIKEQKKFLYLNIFIPVGSMLIFFFSVFTDFMARYMTPVRFGVVPVIGRGKFIYFGFVFFVSLFVIARLLIKYFRSSRDKKLKLQYFFLGIFVFVIANLIFNVVLAFWEGIVRYYQVGNYSIIFLLSFTALAIVKQELFGIKVVITTIFVALTAILLALDTLVFTDTLALQLLKGLILVAFLYLGYALIKSVMREIKQREKIEKLSKAKSEFISIASHQLRTPLTAIKGYISMILEGTYGETSSKVKEPMKKVYISNERLINLVNNLLSISRIESGKMGIEFGKVSIEGLISNIVDMFGIEAKKKKIFLRFKKSKKPLPKVLIDKEKITDVISNIISNCIKYTGKGGITVKVQKLLPRNRFGVKRKSPKLRITISDTGEGITKEELSKMFQSFSRGMAGTKLYTEGAGLGLYVAKKYVEMHHGKIWAESAGRNKGSTFYIELPMR